jgi:hypothetical protein
MCDKNPECQPALLNYLKLFESIFENIFESIFESSLKVSLKVFLKVTDVIHYGHYSTVCFL